MAVALIRTGTGLCVKCIHRKLCRVVWRQQAALFSSKASDRKQPRRTHIKKAKAQPAVDVAKLLEQLFSQRRPDTAHRAAGKAHPANASSMPTEPPSTSSKKVTTSNLCLFSKTEPAVYVCPAASSAPKKTTSATQLSPQTLSVSQTNPKISFSRTLHPPPLEFIQTFAADGFSNEIVPPTPASPLTSVTPASLHSEDAECKPPTETTETKVESATEPFHRTAVPVLPPSAYIVETNMETSSFLSPTGECLTKTTAESSVESSRPLIEALETERPVEPTVDAPAEEAQTKTTDSGVTDVSHTVKEEHLIKPPSPVEGSALPAETLQTRAADSEGSLEPTIDVTADTAAKDMQTKCTGIDATESAAVDIVAAETDDLATSPALNEVLPAQKAEEEGAQTDASGSEEDLDPIQKLYLDKIREYNNLPRLTGGPLEADPDYKRYLSEETATLQKLYGGGDLSSFPQFTFTEPNMDQDCK